MDFRINSYDGSSYPEPVAMPTASIDHALFGSTVTRTPFDIQGEREILATLGVHEHLTTALTGADNDLTFIARSPGASTVTITYVDPAANNAALSVAVSGNDITVNLATGSGGAITSTAAQIKAAIEADAAADALVAVLLATGNDGSGVVTAMAQDTLDDVPGTNPTLDVILESTVDGTNYETIATFTQLTAVGSEAKAIPGLGLKCRWKLTIGGTDTPIFPVSIVAEHRP